MSEYQRTIRYNKMTEHEILNIINKSKKEFGPKCSKFTGALTVELIRKAFKEEGIPVSDRDVFIKGIPVEHDLIVPHSSSRPKNRILYDNKDVRIVLEIKSRGIFGETAINNIRNNFEKIKRLNNKIKCIYVTISDRKTYKWKATKHNINSPAYTLFWHKGPEENMHFESTGDWARLIIDIKKALVM
jgi:hypothetical protein